ncbi:chemotaxis protein CheW [Paracoccus sp. (in: a-proteobacteria)]|uniref:chemotaxis protein CheW n=1 Tax=Paracoccus sp. TaxID=267 RepID=UPI00396C8739
MTALQTKPTHEPAEPWLPANADASPSEPDTYLTVELAGQIFAIDVADVREILDMQPISRLPNAPSDLIGMIDVRGEGIAILDLPSRLGLERLRTRAESRIVVLELGRAPRHPVGVIADRVLSVVAVTADGIEPAPATLTHWRSDALVGIVRIGEQLTMVLALERLFAADAPGPFDFG